MNDYRFAQLFVKISRILGVVVLVCGIGLTGLSFLAIQSEYDAAEYKPDESLSRLLKDLSHTKNRTLRILREKRLIGSRVYFSNSIPFEAPSNLNEVESLEISLSAWRSDTDKLKTSLLEEFEESVETIREKLLKFVDSLEDEPSGSEREKQRVKPAPKESLIRHIFDEESRATFPERISSMEKVKGFLQRLHEESNQEESKETLARAIIEIEALIKLVPTEINSSVSISPEVTREKETLRAELVAEALEEAIATMRIVVYERWAIQTSLSQTSERANLEKRKMENAKKLRREILLHGVGRLLGLILASLLASFLILVISDFLQTQLDIAGNSSILAGNR
jgi:hypothetical protein